MTAKEKKPFQLFNLPLPIFLIIAAVTILATYTGTLPAGMAGCFLFMIVLGTILGWIGDHTPIIKSYLGGGRLCASSDQRCWSASGSFRPRRLWTAKLFTI